MNNKRTYLPCNLDYNSTDYQTWWKRFWTTIWWHWWLCPQKSNSNPFCTREFQVGTLCTSPQQQNCLEYRNHRTLRAMTTNLMIC